MQGIIINIELIFHYFTTQLYYRIQNTNVSNIFLFALILFGLACLFVLEHSIYYRDIGIK